MLSIVEREKDTFKLIALAGDARSCYLECMQLYHSDDIEGAKQALIRGNQVLQKGSLYRSQFIKKEKVTLLLELHALDLFMSAEILCFGATQLLDVYHCFHNR